MKLEDIHADDYAARLAFVERFWSQVAIGETDECWEWTSRKAPHGKARLMYGRVYVGSGRAQVTAHRIAYVLANGEVPDHLSVCHSCDNPPCCNPAHLWAGTGKQNAADRDQKGRYVLGKRYKGVRPAVTKLTSEQVREIRRDYIPGSITQKELGLRYGVDENVVSQVIRRKTFKDVV